MTVFSGSYNSADVQFLLQVQNMPTVSIDEKERLIRLGEHYGRLLSNENPPSEIYQNLFWATLERNAAQVTTDVIALARYLQNRNKTVLVSLARGGTPIGILLKHTLALLGVQTNHYSVSIIRDHGIDFAALEYVLERHADSQIAFIDGWTGKGVIARELEQSVKDFNSRLNCQISGDLHVLSDPGGFAATAATRLDYLLPNAMLNATVSGLVSRSFLTTKGFHGVMELPDLQEFDVSNQYIAVLMHTIKGKLEVQSQVVIHAESERQKQILKVLESIAIQYNTSLNLVKPGVGEATRVLLRRSPQVLILNAFTADTLHLENLAADQCEIIQTPIPYSAIAVIAKGENT
jgi:Phosphoribosyl transferase (PRTase)/PELOTA RNA binding domain